LKFLKKCFAERRKIVVGIAWLNALLVGYPSVVLGVDVYSMGPLLLVWSVFLINFAILGSVLFRQFHHLVFEPRYVQR
jgi:hypothetical protein